MKSASPELIAILDSGSFYMADLYTLVLRSGAVIRMTGADTSISYLGNVFVPVAITRGRTRLTVGIEVDTLEVDIHEPLAVGSSNLFELAVNGGLYGATLRVERAIMAVWGDTSPGAVHVFDGRVTKPVAGIAGLHLSVQSESVLLNVEIPRRLYQPGCPYVLYGSACGKSAIPYTLTCGAGSTRQVLELSLGAYEIGRFSGGVVTFTTGALTGVSRSIKTHDTTGTLVLMQALPSSPAGLKVKLRQACFKTRAACEALSNLPNFGGFPDVPLPETVAGSSL